MPGPSSPLAELMVDPAITNMEVLTTQAKNLLAEAEYPKYTSERKTNSRQVDMMFLGTTGQAGYTTKMGPYRRVGPREGYGKRVALKDLAAAVDFAWVDIQLANANGANAKKLLSVQKESIEKSLFKARNREGAACLILGRMGSTIPASFGGMLDTLCADGLSLFNTAHKFDAETSATWSNMLSSGGALPMTPASIVQVDNILGQYVDGDGFPLPLRGMGMLISRNLRNQTMVIAHTEKQPGEFINDVNHAKQTEFQTLEPIICNLFPADTWIVKTDAGPETLIQHLVNPALDKADVFEKSEPLAITMFHRVTESFVAPTEGWGYFLPNVSL